MANFEINSIININSVPAEVKDTIKPYTFIEFISRTNFGNSKDVFLTYYKEYLMEWSKVKKENNEIVDTKELIQNQIINLLKIITVSYATYEEQVFLANLNWDYNNLDDPFEKARAKNAIYSALPIFVSRIKDIASFYRDKRTEATFSIQRNKIKGTQLSVEKIIFDKILSFLFNESPEQINYVQNYLNVSIDNFVDIYSDYFDIDRTTSNTTDYNDIDSSIYFELESILKDMIFDGNVYLKEIPLIAQLSIDLSQDCVGDKLALKNELLADSCLSLIDDEEKIAIRKRLYQKYLGVDFYYLYKKEDGEIVNDIFIKADNPSNNLLNQQTADTPFNESKQLELLKNIGLFFKPDKTSILRVNTVNFDYFIDEDKVETNKIYIFPDPKIYGNVAFNRQANYPYIIEYSFAEYSKNFNFGFASNDPLVVSDAQPMYSYYSREQDTSKLNKNHKIKLDFDELYNKGYITALKSDLYGNKFALYKEQKGKFAKDWNIKPFKPAIKTEPSFLIVDGGVLGDSGEESSTEISADKLEWGPLNHYYHYLIEGGLSTITPQYFRAYIPDGATRGNGDLSLSVHLIKDETGTAFVDGGTFDTDYGSFETYDTNNGIPKVLYLGDEFASELIDDSFKPNYEENKKKTYFEIENKIGEIYVSIPSLQKTLPIREVFTWWETDVDKEIYNFYLNNVVDIDIIENVFIIKAINPETGGIHLLFEGVEFNVATNTFEQKFTNKQTIFFHNENSRLRSTYYNAFNCRTFRDFIPAFFEGNENICDKGSNIFYVEKLHKCYFAVMNVSIASKEVNGETITYPIYYPDIYEIDLINFSCKKYYFTQNNAQNEQQAESFKIPDTLYREGAVMIQKGGTPYLTYSFDSNTFMLTYVVYDINHCPYVYKHFFQLSINGVEYYGEIDSNSLDSTVYNPSFTGEASIITPGDKNNVLNLNFNTNYIIS